jgi:hypothetical protein
MGPASERVLFEVLGDTPRSQNLTVITKFTEGEILRCCDYECYCLVG